MDCQRRLLYVARRCVERLVITLIRCQHGCIYVKNMTVSDGHQNQKKKNLNFSFVVPSWYYAINRCCAGDYIAVYILCAFKSPHSQPKGVNAGIHSTIDSCAVLVSSYPSGAIRHHQGTTGRGITPAPYQVHQNKYKKDDGNSEW
jgi:hypothetical protein